MAWDDVDLTELHEIRVALENIDYELEQHAVGLYDRYAMAALTGILARQAGEHIEARVPAETAALAYEYADAMMKARSADGEDSNNG